MSKVKKFPYVCANCNLKYTKCKFHQFKYDAKFAQVKADRLLVSSRIGVNYTKEEIEKLIIELKVGLSNKNRYIKLLRNYLLILHLKQFISISETDKFLLKE